MQLADKWKLVQRELGLAADGIPGEATADRVLALLGTPLPVKATSPGLITLRTANELISHESIVREAYRDSKGIWTWSVGVTNASGHNVDRYKDNPQTVYRCLEIYVWLLKTRYAPDVLRVFAGQRLSEAQFAAALSFHYNTGAILRASWVKSFLLGQTTKAREQFMEWRSPKEIIERREAERDLFFDGKWGGDGMATVWPVKKPSYTPLWGSGKRISVTAELQELLG